MVYNPPPPLLPSLPPLSLPSSMLLARSLLQTHGGTLFRSMAGRGTLFWRATSSSVSTEPPSVRVDHEDALSSSSLAGRDAASVSGCRVDNLFVNYKL